MKKSFKILGFMFAAVLLFAGLLYIGSERATAADDVTVVTVTDYGANGSDTKSDRTAIQNCLNMAKDGKAVKVVIPAGKYYIDDVLIAYDNTTISLAADAEIIRMDDTKLMLANYRDQVTGGYGQGSNIIVEGGKWNGNVKNTTHLSPLMLFYHAQNITVRNTDVGSYCARHAIIFGGVKKGTVDNVKIHDFVAYTGTDPDGEYYTSDDEFESLCTMEALHLDCIATDGKSEAGALPLDGTPCAEITVSNCTFTNVPVGLGNHYEGYPATGLTVSKNTFSNIKYVCIDSYSYRNVDISGNTAQNVSSFAKFIDSTGTVSGNNITCKATTDKLYGIYVYTNSNIEVNSNTITDSNLDAIALYNAKSSSISNNKIYSPKDNGIAVYGAKSVVTKINDNTVQNGKNGIVLSYSSAGVIHGNTITQPSEHGISLVNNATAEISLNEITSPTKNGVSVNKSTATVTANNIKDPVAVGVGLYSASNSEVSKNTITNAGTHGIEVSSSTSCEINGNIIRLPKAQGVRIYASKTITADSNTVVTAAKNGIFIGSSSVTVRSNKISDAKEHGIMVQNNSTGIISSNTVTSPVKNGVSVNNAAVTVSSNKISDAGNVGVMIYNSKQSASKTVSDNQISNAGSHGIEVSDSASCKVNGNTVSFPGGHGIRVYASKTVTVSSNTVDTAARNGVYIDASTVTAQNNNISGAKEHGIIVQNGSTGTISGNKITSPVKNGVNVNNAAVTVSSNTVSYSGDMGIMIYNSKQTASKTVSSNTITGSKGIAIQVNDSSNVTVRSNSVNNCLKHGIQAYQSSNVSITDNVVKSSTNHGITVNYSTNTTVTYNTVTGNGSRDLCANDDSTGSASNNAITSGADRAWTYSASKFPMTKNGYEYWISYNANGGTGSMATTTVMYGVSTPTIANAFTRSGYTFTGWTAYRASDKKWYCGSDGWRTDAEINANGYKKHIYPNKSSVAKTTAVNGDKVTFYAQWKSNIITYTIKYNANGGSGSMADQTVTYGVSTATRANAFKRSGYTFAGWTVYRASDKKWHCGSDGWRTDTEIAANGYKKFVYANTAKIATTTAVNGDTVTFYAQWKNN